MNIIESIILLAIIFITISMLFALSSFLPKSNKKTKRHDIFEPDNDEED